MTDGPSTPAGWYPDPTNPGKDRYWDGTAWVERWRPSEASMPPPPSSFGANPGSYGNLGGPPTTPPPNHLVWAILSTLFCCLPIGIVSIVKASQVSTLWAAGDTAGAIAASNDAKKWATISAVVSLSLWVVWFLLSIVIGTGSSSF